MRAVTSKGARQGWISTEYIANNPSKFANRKILSVEQIGFPFGPTSQSFVDANKDAKSLDDIDQKLTSAGIPHGRQMGVLKQQPRSSTRRFLQHDRGQRRPTMYFSSTRSGANGVFFKVKRARRPVLWREKQQPILPGKLLESRCPQGRSWPGKLFRKSPKRNNEGEYAKIMQQGEREQEELKQERAAYHCQWRSHRIWAQQSPCLSISWRC